MIDARFEALRCVRIAAEELLIACMAVTPHVAVHLHRAFDSTVRPNSATDEMLLRLIDAQDVARH